MFTYTRDSFKLITILSYYTILSSYHPNNHLIFNCINLYFYYSNVSNLSCQSRHIIPLIYEMYTTLSTLSLISCRASKKNNSLFWDLFVFIYHLTNISRKLIIPNSSTLKFVMPNIISNSVMINFMHIWNIQSDNLTHIFLLSGHSIKWCSIVSISLQQAQMLSVQFQVNNFSLVFTILLKILYWKLWKYVHKLFYMVV